MPDTRGVQVPQSFERSTCGQGRSQSHAGCRADKQVVEQRVDVERCEKDICLDQLLHVRVTEPDRFSCATQRSSPLFPEGPAP